MNIIAAPFSLLYGSVLALRNWAFDRGILPEHEFEIPIISVGNLSVGGTGKSPMIEYLITLLSHEYKNWDELKLKFYYNVNQIYFLLL